MYIGEYSRFFLFIYYGLIIRVPSIAWVAELCVRHVRCYCYYGETGL
jgi:hypothetical protein